jgi:hypothetical protein
MRGHGTAAALAAAALAAAGLLALLAACGGGRGSGALDGGADGAAGDVRSDAAAPLDGAPDAPAASDAADAGPPGDAVPDAAPDLAPDGFVGIENAGVRAWEQDGRVFVDNGRLRLTFDLAAGLLRVEEAAGPLVLRHATALARFRVDAMRGEARLSDPGVRTWEARPFVDPLGEGLSLVVSHEPAEGGPALTVVYDLRGAATYLTAALTARWADTAGAAVRVDRLSPVAADARSDGGLFVGPDPRTHRWLDNGFDLYFDFSAFVVPATRSASLLFAPGESSNWNAALYDPASRRSVVAGFLSAERGIGLVVVHWPPAGGPRDGEREGFRRFEGLAHYDGGRAAIPAADGGPGAALGSELFYLDAAPSTVFDGLEDYAARYARRIGKVLPAAVPTGWNSWGGGAGSGGYGTNIDEALMLANLEAAARDFRPYGMRWFLIDDGWQQADGDWFPDPARFPDHLDANGAPQNGLAWLADQVRAAGLIPGVWISPFDMDVRSQLAAEHPDWAVDVSPLGTVVPDDVFVLDLSRPEVLDWLAETFRRLTHDWGLRWIKMDFTYFALFAQNLHDPAVTPSEAYHTALVRLREAMHPDAFFLTLTPMGLAYDVADGNRLGLDNEPWWGSAAENDQGLHHNYPTTARRWYLNHRVFVNHPDLVYFRPDFGLTMNEARAWISAVALTGGIVKLGDSYVELAEHPEWRAVLERVLPVYPRSGRPLDVFERELPEVWHLAAEREGRTWAVLGLYHWGQNRDVGRPDWEAEAPRTLRVDLADLGLDPTQRHLVFRAWDQTWTWEEGGAVEEWLAPRMDAVFVVRPAPVEPAVVFTSRHLLGGAVEVHDEAFGADDALTATVDTVPGAPLTVWVATAGRIPEEATASGSDDVGHEVTDGLLALRCTPRTDATEVRVTFAP